jgi:pyridoxamine 5'-phosphate oxidase
VQTWWDQGVSPEGEPTRIADLRVTYDTGTLEYDDLAGDPLTAFRDWFEEAVRAELPEPNAMTLATADASGRPSARTVLLKGADERGFLFYTNLTSRKGRELLERPQASLVFPWFAMHRQVVIVGDVEQVPREETAAYFASRPQSSQLGAWVSRQSEVIADRGVLERRYLELEQRFVDGEVPLPEFWGGWLLRPMTIEFWQGRPSRLHDRLRFRATSANGPATLDSADDWVLERLAP